MQKITEEYILNNFRNAIERDYITPYFQPIYRSVTGKIACAESLARWIDPDIGMITPPEFIPVLENHGLIYDLDMAILRKTCEFYKRMRDRGTLLRSFSINLSRHDFVHDALFDEVGKILAEYDVPHEAIKLEITESLMIEDIDTFQRVFRQFSEAGYSIWIDDFGSGYSSLNMLQNYSFDMLKLDMLFLQSFSERSRLVLASVINMAKTLGIHTLTEGVETEEHKKFLQSIGCETQQGFLYSKPVSPDDLMAKVDENPSVLESIDDGVYWNKIGNLNYLNASPLEEFSEREMPTGGSDYGDGVLPIALLECTGDKNHFIFASKSFMENIYSLGFKDLDELERVSEDHQSDQYLMIKKLVSDTISSREIKKVEYINNNVYYRLSSKCLAKTKDKAMLAMRLSTFDSEGEKKTANEIMNYGNALFSTYELVVLLYPESGVANRIYNAQHLPVYDQEVSLSDSVRKFCEAQVAPVDQARYLKFMDMSTMKERIDKSKKGFVQGFFRMRWDKDECTWYTARVTRVPFEETTYILTVQTIQGTGENFLELIDRNHSDLLEQ